jgi:hypothetical protein
MTTLIIPYLLTILGLLYVLQKITDAWLKHMVLGWKWTGILFVISTAVSIIPIKNISLAKWVMGVNANFSIPLTILIIALIWNNIPHKAMVDKSFFQTAWIFGFLTGLFLYPMGLGLGNYDPYQLGWGFSWWFVIVFILTIVLLYKKNYFAILLIASILAFDFHLLESTNFWDYLIDPAYFILSFYFLAFQLVKERKHS